MKMRLCKVKMFNSHNHNALSTQLIWLATANIGTVGTLAVCFKHCRSGALRFPTRFHLKKFAKMSMHFIKTKKSYTAMFWCHVQRCVCPLLSVFQQFTKSAFNLNSRRHSNVMYQAAAYCIKNISIHLPAHAVHLYSFTA